MSTQLILNKKLLQKSFAFEQLFYKADTKMVTSLSIIWAIFLVLLNGFFVAAEFAMVRLRTTKIEILKATKGFRGAILAKIHEDIDSYLSACQLGITLASLGLGWVGEPAFAHFSKPILEVFGVVSETVVEIISYVIAFSIISFLHIVVGELMPKTMAIRQAEKISLLTAIPLYGFYWILFPVIYCLNGCAFILLKMFKLDSVDEDEGAYSIEELKIILTSSHLHGEIEHDEARMLTKALEFTALLIGDVMQPIVALVALDNEHPVKNNLALIADHHYSRYPVYEKNIENILGIIHAKDCFAASVNSAGITSFDDLLRPALKINISEEALDLLPKFQNGTTHLALVYQDEQLIGFVTLDNLLQALIGKIKDDFHPTK